MGLIVMGLLCISTSKKEIKKDNVVLFRIAGYIRHIGYMIDDKHFIHVLKGRNVTIESVEDTIWKNRVAGAYKWSS